MCAAAVCHEVVGSDGTSAAPPGGVEARWFLRAVAAVWESLRKQDMATQGPSVRIVQIPGLESALASCNWSAPAVQSIPPGHLDLRAGGPSPRPNRRRK